MHSFVAIDFETANQHRQSACEWGFSVWDNGTAVAASGVLLQPPAPYDYFDPFNVSLHGITAEMCEKATDFEQVLERLADSFKKVPVVAHNAGFDMSVIRKTCEHLGIRYPEMNYFCTLVLARKSFASDASIVNFKLETLINHIGYDWDQEHRAEGDAIAAGQLAKFLLDKHNAASIEELADVLGVRAGKMGGEIDRRCEVKAAPSEPLTAEELSRRAEALKQFQGIEEWDPSGDFDAKHVKFTGAFSRPKADYEAALVECGGVAQKTVNRKTDFVVEGLQASAQDQAGGSRAQKTAMELKAAGSDIEVIDEVEFLRLLTT